MTFSREFTALTETQQDKADTCKRYFCKGRN